MPLPTRCDLVIRGGKVVSVHTGEIWPADVVIVGDAIRALVAPGTPIEADLSLDAAGLLVAPGYIDAHMHIESSLLPPGEFTRMTLPHGTTTVLADPHEIVNVAGREGMAWMIEQGRGHGQTMLWAVPSCVPSLDGFETAGARLTADDIAEMLTWDGVTTLGEVMDYRAVVSGDPRMHAIVAAARAAGVRLDGHCPNLSGDELGEYLWAGIDSDHTKNTAEVAVEKARLGMLLMLQLKCLTPEVVGALRALPHTPDFCLVTDDLAADAILESGHLDQVARAALEAGFDPLTVLRALTLNPARRLGLDDRGVVAPGRRADLVLLRTLDEPSPVTVVSGGAVVEPPASLASPASAASLASPDSPDSAASLASPDSVASPVAVSRGFEAPVHPFGDTVRLDALADADLHWRVDLPDGDHAFRALRVNPVDTFTEPDEITLPVRDGRVLWEGRTTVVAVYERHHRSGRRTMAPVLGFDLEPGAVATTYAHDSHNLTLIGNDPAAMRAAANEVITARGGLSVVRTTPGGAHQQRTEGDRGADDHLGAEGPQGVEGHGVEGHGVEGHGVEGHGVEGQGGGVRVTLPLPIAGLLSEQPAPVVAEGAAAIRTALHAWGWRHRNAFMSISTLTLPVSPQVKLTDQGLVHVITRSWEPATVG